MNFGLVLVVFIASMMFIMSVGIVPIKVGIGFFSVFIICAILAYFSSIYFGYDYIDILLLSEGGLGFGYLYAFGYPALFLSLISFLGNAFMYIFNIKSRP